jgi:glucokinase
MGDTAHTLGVDIGATNVKIAAVTCDGQVLAKMQFSTLNSGVSGYRAEIRNRLEALEGELGRSLGIGVAAPGLVDTDHRSVYWMHGRMETICGVDWTDALRAASKVPVLNDAKSALLGEVWIGAAKGASNAILLTLGTGIGGAALVDGHLLHGAIGRAGHLGHICLDPAGLPDIVGTPGSLEDQFGNATRALVECVRQGDAFAIEIWHRSIQALAAGIVSLINVLDPSVVVLGGGVARASDLLFEPLNAAVAKAEWRPFGTGVPIVPAALGEYAGAVGAARSAMLYGSDQPFGAPVHAAR